MFTLFYQFKWSHQLLSINSVYDCILSYNKWTCKLFEWGRIRRWFKSIITVCMLSLVLCNLIIDTILNFVLFILKLFNVKTFYFLYNVYHFIYNISFHDNVSSSISWNANKQTNWQNWIDFTWELNKHVFCHTVFTLA